MNLNSEQIKLIANAFNDLAVILIASAAIPAILGKNDLPIVLSGITDSIACWFLGLIILGRNNE